MSPPSPVSQQPPPMPVVFPPEQQIIHTDEDSNVDVVNESGEEPPQSQNTSTADLPIDLSAKKPRSLLEDTPTLPAYKFTPLTLKQPQASHPPPAYDTRPPPPPYQVWPLTQFSSVSFL